VEKACKKEGTQNILASLEQQYNKYRLVEGQLLRSSDSMRVKIPEIEKTLQMIQVLKGNPSNLLAYFKKLKLTLC
jgi:hypothetical protein